MSSLFFRAFSQSLQALMPIAAALVCGEAGKASRLAAAIKRGLVLSIPLSIVAGEFFRASSHQSLDEAVLAVAAVVVGVSFALALPRDHSELHGSIYTEVTARTRVAITAVTCLLVVRQAMEVVSVLHSAAIEVRSLNATTAVLAGFSLGLGVTWLCARLGRRLTSSTLVTAVRAFWLVFIGQSVIYAFHEVAEARLLPWSESLHTATEPYSPDGLYGVHFSDLFVAAPLLAVAFIRAAPRFAQGLRGVRGGPIRRRAAITVTALILCVTIGLQQSDARAPQGAARATQAAIEATLARPHILFRHTALGPSFGALAVAALDAPAGVRRVTDLTCERVSFGGGRGLCLHLQRGVFNRYTAQVLDRTLKPGPVIKLQGLPSRTRSAADGQIGAVTVFVIGDGYASDFSTRTTLIDLSSGDEIGELEQFSTWRDGARIRAADFNFWGVTFAQDGNIFYAALRTAGKTYLVRGELALRRLTIVRENAECPSLSPDNRLLAYKKRVGPSPDSWRLHVLDLQTNVERIVSGEERFVDDQVEWLDQTHLLYGVRRRTMAISDVWVASVENGEAARVLIPEAESPVVVR
jgi:hypothetical protein